MPPSHHSSSSHRSSGSHRVSSHSSSSHRSSYSGVSSHSSSSSYSSYSGYSYTGSRSYGGYGRSGSSSAKTGGYAEFTRNRSNQPTGYHTGLIGYKKPKAFHCARHDYLYYASDWVDEYTGRSYQKGYYDESGNYYKNIAFRDTKKVETIFICEYCGTEVKSKWESGEKPNCPNCSAQLKEVEVDEIRHDTNPFDAFDYTPDYREIARERNRSILNLVGIIVAVMFFMAGGLAAISYETAEGTGAQSADRSIAATAPVSGYYVPELQRNCPWISAYDSFFDIQTQCYFYYNDEIEYPDWQYWYEGISSDYGEYGWMEYEIETDQWFIEVSDGKWIKLPDKYYSDRLWYTIAKPAEQ